MDDSKESREARQRIADIVRGTMLLSCRPASAASEEITRQWVDGEITIDQAINITRARYGLPLLPS